MDVNSNKKTCQRKVSSQPPNAWEKRIDEHIQEMPYSPQSQPDFERLVRLIWRFRQEGGCPWDIKQTHTSITKHFIEEAYEAVDALERGNNADIVEELGDVLEQVILHAQIARDEGAFTIEDVCRALAHKLIFRHPHVFGAYPEELLCEDNEGTGSNEDASDVQKPSDTSGVKAQELDTSREVSDEKTIYESSGKPSYTAKTADEVLDIWSEVKRRERTYKEDEKNEEIGILDSIPIHLPALMQVQKMHARLEEYGLELTNTRTSIDTQNLNELHAQLIDENISGEEKQAMFSQALCELIGMAQEAHIDAESALRIYASDVRSQMKRIERGLHKDGKTFESVSPEELLSFWKSLRTPLGGEDDTMNESSDTYHQITDNSQG